MDSYWGSPESKWFTAASILAWVVGTVFAWLVR